MVLLAGASIKGLAQNDSLQALLREAPGPVQRIPLLIQLGNEVRETDTTRAVLYFREAMALAESSPELVRWRGQAALTMGRYFEQRFRYDSARKYADLAVAAFDESDDPKGQAEANILLSDLLDTEDKRAEAIKMLFKSLNYYEEINDSLETGRVLNRIANSQNYLGYHDDALLHYGRAMRIFEAIGYERGVAVVLSNMAIIYGEEGDFRKSINNYLKTIRIYEGLPSEPNLPSAYNNIGNDYSELNSPDSALYYFNKSLALSEARGDIHSMAFTYSHLNTFYNKQGQPGKGILYGEKSLALARKLNNSQLLINLNKSLSESYEAQGNYRQALVHHKQYQVLEDSVYNVANSQVIHDMQARYETEKKEKDLALKQADIERQQVLLEEEARIRIILILGLVIVLGLAGYIFRGERLKARAYSQLKQKSEEIENKNRVIEGALLEKEALLKEIHHRVKNNLQVISSILNMQSRSTASPEMLTAIQEGQSRVKAMALIHQKLYQTEKLSEIDFHEYAGELVTHLSSIFSPQKGEGITPKIAATNIKLDIDIAIPLGLILNELISNAYKYAFEGSRHGEISVELKRVDGDKLQLDVADNGKGLPADFSLEKAKSLGLKLVNILTRQLNGQLSIQSKGGARFSILIQDMKMTV